MFANYLTAAVPVGLTVLATMTRQCYVLLSLAAATLVAVFTLSTGFAGFALAIGTLMWFWLPKNRLRPLCAAGIVMATGASVIILTLATIASIVPSGEGHIPLGSRDLRLWDESRPSIWSGAVATVRAHPLTGLGYGSLVAVTADPRSFVPADKQDKLETPIEPRHMEAHNVWLSIAGQSGIVGLAAFACLLIVIVRPLWTRIKGSRDLGRHLLIAVAGAFIGAFLYNGLFAAIEEARHIWALFGLMVVVGRHSPQWEE
jgi:O-antigen ligase